MQRPFGLASGLLRQKRPEHPWLSPSKPLQIHGIGTPLLTRGVRLNTSTLCCTLSRDIPPQEQNRKWFRSHLLSRELELQELYDLPQGELDLVMAETAEIRSDPENRSRSHGRWCTAGYVLELAKIIDARRARDLSA